MLVPVCFTCLCNSKHRKLRCVGNFNRYVPILSLHFNGHCPGEPGFIIIIIIIIITSRRQQRSIVSTQSGHVDEPWTIQHECWRVYRRRSAGSMNGAGVLAIAANQDQNGSRFLLLRPVIMRGRLACGHRVSPHGRTMNFVSWRWYSGHREGWSGRQLLCFWQRFWVSRCLLKQRTMEVVSGDNWTAEVISRAKLQSNHHHQQTNNRFSFTWNAAVIVDRFLQHFHRLLRLLLRSTAHNSTPFFLNH